MEMIEKVEQTTKIVYSSEDRGKPGHHPAPGQGQAQSLLYTSLGRHSQCIGGTPLAGVLGAKGWRGLPSLYIVLW
jgi:hypothetical protein